MDAMIIQQHKWAQPFSPFRLVLTDGSVVDVRSSRHILVSAPLVTVGVDIDANGDPADMRIFTPESVERIEPISVEQANP